MHEDKEQKVFLPVVILLDPVNNGELPIWVASFALAHYGTGIVKCSAHDERDFAFAKKFKFRLNRYYSRLRSRISRKR